MSECTNGEVRDLLPELVNGRLDAEALQTVEAHVASCTECAEELALLRSLRPALMRSPIIDTQRIAAAVHAHAAGTAGRAAAPTGIARGRRIAIAAATLIAVSALCHAVRTHRIAAPEVAVVPAPPDAIKDTTHPSRTGPESTRAPIVAPPRTAPVHAPQQRVAVASTGVLDNISDLSDDDVRTLTASLDKLSSVPDADPAPGIDPLGASLEDNSEGGS